jgi:hypothetical protein
MAKNRKKIDNGTANQLSLFDLIEEITPEKFALPEYQPDSKPLTLRIKEAIGEAVKNSGLKRYDIAGRMSEHLGMEITESMLNSYTAESKEGYRMPAEYMPIFCKITQDYTPLDILVAAAGARLVKSDEIFFLEMGRLEQAEKSIQQKRAEMKKEFMQQRRGKP